MSGATTRTLSGPILVAVDLPANLLGNYHIPGSSPAVNLGASSKNGVNAPAFDIDGDARPSAPGFEAGADEIAGGGGPVVVPFPSTGLLDDFNRGSGSTTALGANWSGSISHQPVPHQQQQRAVSARWARR